MKVLGYFLVLGLVFSGASTQARVSLGDHPRLRVTSGGRPLYVDEIHASLGWTASDPIMNALIGRVLQRLKFNSINQLQGIIWYCDDLSPFYDGEFRPNAKEIRVPKRLAEAGWVIEELKKYPTAIDHRVLRSAAFEILQIELQPTICMTHELDATEFAPLLLHELSHLADWPKFSEIDGGVSDKTYPQFLEMRLWAPGGELPAYGIQRRALDVQPLQGADNFLSPYYAIDGTVYDETKLQNYILNQMGYGVSIAGAWTYYVNKNNERKKQILVSLQNLKTSALQEQQAASLRTSQDLIDELDKWILDIDTDIWNLEERPNSVVSF